MQTCLPEILMSGTCWSKRISMCTSGGQALKNRKSCWGGLVILKWISFDFLLWLRIAFSHKQDGNCQSKNLASHSAFLEFWEDFGGGGWFCLLLTFKSPERWSLGCSKAYLHSDLGIFSYCLGIYWACLRWLLVGNALKFFPWSPLFWGTGGVFLLPCSKVNTTQLKQWGHVRGLVLPCVTTHLGSLGCKAHRDMGCLVKDGGTMWVQAASAETEDWKKGIKQVHNVKVPWVCA